MVVAALDAYANQELWPEVARLIPWSVSLTKLNAVCGNCGADASLTITNSGRASVAKTQIGAKEMYDARCIRCVDIENLVMFSKK